MTRWQYRHSLHCSVRVVSAFIRSIFVCQLSKTFRPVRFEFIESSPPFEPIPDCLVDSRKPQKRVFECNHLLSALQGDVYGVHESVHQEVSKGVVRNLRPATRVSP